MYKNCSNENEEKIYHNFYIELGDRYNDEGKLDAE